MEARPRSPWLVASLAQTSDRGRQPCFNSRRSRKRRARCSAPRTRGSTALWLKGPNQRDWRIAGGFGPLRRTARPVAGRMGGRRGPGGGSAHRRRSHQRLGCACALALHLKFARGELPARVFGGLASSTDLRRRAGAPRGRRGDRQRTGGLRRRRCRRSRRDWPRRQMDGRGALLNGGCGLDGRCREGRRRLGDGSRATWGPPRAGGFGGR